MPRWTPEARAKQSKAIRQWKPWEKSTGPRTEAGKRRSRENYDNYWDNPEQHSQHRQTIKNINEDLAKMRALGAALMAAGGGKKRRRRRRSGGAALRVLLEKRIAAAKRKSRHSD